MSKRRFVIMSLLGLCVPFGMLGCLSTTRHEASSNDAVTKRDDNATPAVLSDHQIFTMKEFVSEFYIDSSFSDVSLFISVFLGNTEITEPPPGIETEDREQAWGGETLILILSEDRETGKAQVAITSTFGRMR